MNNTTGFYKNENGLLLFAPNGVTGPSYDLQPSAHTEHTYPVDGWSWFDSEAQARVFFGLPEKIEEDVQGN